MRRLIVGIVLLAALGACSNGDLPSGTVGMTDAHKFTPDTITISVGETVTWRNTSSEQHTVTAVEGSLPDGADYFASGGFSSQAEAEDDLVGGLIDEGAEYGVTLDEPGTYEYYCIPHQADNMRGTVIVRR